MIFQYSKLSLLFYLNNCELSENHEFCSADKISLNKKYDRNIAFAFLVATYVRMYSTHVNHP